jgi:N-acetylglucosaminyldiphosphoundecaprenol N-acetyl-beta-D-mannosaminyltransferase
VDPLSFGEALDAIEALVDAREGGAVFTPNVDHVVTAEDSEAFRAAYAKASLSLTDGMPLVWASHLLGAPVPAKVSGSDLVPALMERAGKRGLRVFLLGGACGVGEACAREMKRRWGVDVVGSEAPDFTLAPESLGRQDVVARVRAARPDLVLVALGSPKQELWIAQNAAALAPAVLLGIGASLDFIAGTVKRAPAWMSNHGLEWLYRLAQEPGRLWRRYLVRDPRFLLIVLRAWLARGQRAALPGLRDTVH